MKELEKKIINYHGPQASELVTQFARDVEEGLTRLHKMLPCKYIYDEEGSLLFREIMALPEYYLTDCETEILRENKGYLADLWGRRDFYLFELGAGDGKKTRILLDHFQRCGLRFHYIPIDISASEVEKLVDKLDCNSDGMKITGLVSEYFQGLKFLSGVEVNTKVVLFLGSNIGNMDPPQACEFLRGIHDSLDPGDFLLIGFDLKKEIEILTRAYNDTAGITARFNKNLLYRINRELGGTFNPDSFAYYSVYDPQPGAMKSYLVSTKTQEVHIEAIDRSIHLEQWEAIHTESAYKYTEADIESMAAAGGFSIRKNFYDSRSFFIDSLWQVIKDT